MKRLFLLIGLLTIPTGCGYLESNKYSQGTFPETPVNLSEINSVDDDYNSNIQTVGGVLALTFSSKRGGRTDFDFVNESLNISFDLRSGKSVIDNQPYGGLDAVAEQAPLRWAGQTVNSPSNELGPYLRSYDHDLFANQSTVSHFGQYLMLFASDRTGNLDIYLTHNYQAAPVSVTGASGRTPAVGFSDPVPVPCLNSPAEDGYPTFDKTYRTIYFTSNRGGTFDLFKATLPGIAPAELHTSLPALTSVSIERVTELSSPSDDKCPFISGNMLVFTSNRPGGYGGYDLYYSKWTGSNWSTPVNFGPSINTAYDEYRPVLSTLQQFSNQLMVFSSNRPGGKGGFDLYRVGVPD